jgi:hypothetical protein
MSGRSERAIFWHLVRAQVWRLRWLLLGILTIGITAYSTTRPLSMRVQGAFPLLMVHSAGLTVAAFWSRHVRTLPIDQRLAFQSSWIALMAVPTALLLGRLGFYLAGVGGWWSPRLFEPIVTRTMFEALYVGATFTLLAYKEDEPGRDAGWLALPQAVLVMLGQLLWVAIPFAIPELVPVTFAGVTWVHALVAGAVLVLAIWPLIRPRHRWPMLGTVVAERQPAPTHHPGIRAARSRFDRLTGLTRLFPAQVIGGFTISLVALAAGGIFQYFRQGDVGSPFDAGVRDIDMIFGGGAWIVLLIAPFALGSGLIPWLRQLKSLPIKTHQLTLVMTLLPLITPAMFWGCGAVMHLTLTGNWPDQWRWNVLIGLGGVLSASHALGIRLSSRSSLAAAAPFFGLLLSLLLAHELGSKLYFHPTIGLAGLLLAHGLNHHTITRSSSNAAAYRPVPMPAGGAGT